MQEPQREPHGALASLQKSVCAASLALVIVVMAYQGASAASISPTSITFQAVQGGTSPSSQTITVDKGSNGPASWKASESAPWLTLSPGSGHMKRTTQITLSVNPSGLAAGSYTTTVFIDLSKNGGASFPVTLTISTTPTTTSGITTPTTITAASTVAPGSSVSVTVARSSPTATDWLAFFAAGTPATAYMNWVYLPAASQVTASLVAPAVGGPYELRVYRNNTYTDLAGTKALTVAVQSSTTPKSATLTWNLGTESNLAGYKIHVGTASGTYLYPGSPFTIGKVNTYTVNNLPIGQTYFFAVSGFNTAGTDSALSAEVSKSIY